MTEPCPWLANLSLDDQRDLVRDPGRFLPPDLAKRVGDARGRSLTGDRLPQGEAEQLEMLTSYSAWATEAGVNEEEQRRVARLSELFEGRPAAQSAERDSMAVMRGMSSAEVWAAREPGDEDRWNLDV